MTALSNPAIPDAAVAERAYGIWEQEGRPEGREIEHWLRAEAEIRAAAEAGDAMRPARRSATKSTARSATAQPRKRALKTAAE